MPYAGSHTQMPTLTEIDEIDVMPLSQTSLSIDGLGLKLDYVQWQTGLDKSEVCTCELVSR